MDDRVKSAIEAIHEFALACCDDEGVALTGEDVSDLLYAHRSLDIVCREALSAKSDVRKALIRDSALGEVRWAQIVVSNKYKAELESWIKQWDDEMQ